MRQALSAMMGSILLVGMAAGIGGLIYAGYGSENFTSMSCDIETAEVFKLATNKHWITLHVKNNGDYDVSDYSVILQDSSGENILLTETGQVIAPGQKIIQEFSTALTINESVVLLGLVVSNSQNSANCIQEVEVWIK